MGEGQAGGDEERTGVRRMAYVSVEAVGYQPVLRVHRKIERKELLQGLKTMKSNIRSQDNRGPARDQLDEGPNKDEYAPDTEPRGKANIWM